MKAYLLARANEASTWRGLCGLAAAFGLHLSDAKINAIAVAGIGLAGLVGAMLPDKAAPKL